MGEKLGDTVGRSSQQSYHTSAPVADETPGQHCHCRGKFSSLHAACNAHDAGGNALGDRDGEAVGPVVGLLDGLGDGLLVGLPLLGETLGLVLGLALGDVVGR